MTLRDQIQATLGEQYLVESELRGGGMSHVFVVNEQTLGRRIVVKVLPPDTVAQVAIERFKREIKVAASLQHPHIVPLLSAGDINGLPYFTMPFVKGESLRERLMKSGELSVKETLHILRDVASALAYAHGEGVVHRDIKPDNIMLSGGVAVVTDFGVAKAVDVATTEDGGARSALTSLGVALGTPAYMAPEQASADPHVDHRADIYSFGCVAYEMLAGASPFAGRPLQQVLAAHVNEAPEPLTRRRPAVPPALSELVMRCLEKRPGDRPQTADDLLSTLDTIATPSGGSAPTGARLAPPRPNTPWRWLTIGAVAVLIVAGVIGVWLARRGGPPILRPGRVLSVATTSALELSPAISPDGKFVAYMGGDRGMFRIMVRQISGERATVVSGELTTAIHEYPHWSPDGSQIAFATQGDVYIVAATGGAPRTIAHSDASIIVGLCFSPDGNRIAYADSRGVWVRPVAGGPARLVVPGSLFNSVSWSPDGRKLAFLEGNVANFINQSAAPVWVADVATGARNQAAPPEWINLSPVWLPDSRGILYVSNRDGPPDVYQQALTADGRADGAPQRLTTGLRARTISLSADGRRLAYDVVRNQSNIWSIDLPAGSAPATTSSLHQITSESQRIEVPNLSRDGQWLAYDSNRNGSFDIFRIKVDGGDPIQVSNNPGNEFAPSWSPGDRQILFHSSRDGRRQIYSIAIDGTDEHELTHFPFNALMLDQSADGKRILIFAADQSKQKQADQAYVGIVTQDAAGNWTSLRRVNPPDEPAAWAKFSPDNRWIAYVRTRGGTAGFLKVVDAEGRGPTRTLFDHAGIEVVQHLAFGQDNGVVYFNTRDSTQSVTFYAVPLAGGAPRVIFRDDPAHPVGREDFAVGARRLYLTIAADESDVYTMDLGAGKGR
ncbi:MAG TPA: protein kinase [Gemmatimonadaceae bacterium]|nr:protein kinase [Gemmatimonadaceae bacterium]